MIFFMILMIEYDVWIVERMNGSYELMLNFRSSMIKFTLAYLVFCVFFMVYPSTMIVCDV